MSLKEGLCTSALVFAIALGLNAQQFVNASEDWGIDTYTLGIWGAGVAAVDYDLDGDVDLALLGEGIPMELWRNEGSSFVEDAPAFVSEGTEMVTFVDYDNDGDLDIYVTQNGFPNVLYANVEGLYSNATASAGLPSLNDASYGHCWGDINNDGFLDLYVCNYYTGDTGPQDTNYLYLNNGDGSFTDISVASGADDGQRSSFQSVFVDYDRDGDQDIFVANDRTPFENTLYRNEGDNTFTNVTFGMGVGDYIWSMSSTVADYDQDGDLDIYVCNNADGNYLLEYNQDGNFFSNTAPATGAEVNAFCWGAQFFDHDNDGDQDLYVQSQVFEFWNSYGYNFLYTQDDGEFVVEQDESFYTETTNSFSSGVADFNLDGHLDLFSHSLPPEGSSLWINQATSGNFLNVDLQGVQSNTFGVGSFIEAWYAGDHYQMQYVMCGEAYLSQAPYTEHFGLGEATVVDSMKVTWLSGIVDHYFDIPVNQTITLVEGDASAPISIAGNLQLCDGESVTLSITGFETVVWSNEVEGDSIVVTEPGIYSAVVTNADGVVFTTGTVAVTAVQPMDWTVSLVPPLCFPDSTAALNLTGPEADQAFFSPTWDADPTALNLDQTTWYVEDATGCTYSGTVSFVVPEFFEVALTFDSPTCAGDSTGWVSYEVFGGTPPYNLPEPYEDVPSGLYGINVQDDNGCWASNAVFLEDPTPLELLVTSSDVSCHGGNDGSITVFADGGTGPLSLDLPTPLDALQAGEYTLTVTDSVGCVTESLVILSEPEPLVLNVDLSGVNDQGLGAFVMNAEGGTPPMTFTVDGVPCTPPCLAEPGEFELLVTDDNGCTTGETLVITHIEGAVSEAFALWPNPANNTVQLKGHPTGASMIVYNGLGQKMFVSELEVNNHEFSVEHWPEGMYTVVVISDMSLSSLRLVVTH